MTGKNICTRRIPSPTGALQSIALQPIDSCGFAQWARTPKHLIGAPSRGCTFAYSLIFLLLLGGNWVVIAQAIEQGAGSVQGFQEAVAHACTPAAMAAQASAVRRSLAAGTGDKLGIARTGTCPGPRRRSRRESPWRPANRTSPPPS